ncbi:hypothetical protein BDR06DRAFT_1014279 [Suillus hirtellus]|nr:hypothetical protein BDR06DRAFT_1014279 [Suillus hirtellus]
MPSSTINMFEDNILVEIDGVHLYVEYISSQPQYRHSWIQVIFWFKDIEKIIRQGLDNVDNQPSSTVVTEDKIKTESDSPQTTVKFEDEDVKLELEGGSAPAEEDGTNSMTVSLCKLLTQRCHNPKACSTDPFASWRYLVQPFDRSNVATQAAKRKALSEEIRNYSEKRRKV